MGWKQTKDKHEFRPLLVEIEERPINPLGRTLLWTIIALIVLASAWLYFAKIDVVVSARGKVIPDGEIKILQPIETGVISSILVKEGEMVKEGQTLMEIDPSVTETDLESKKATLALLEMEMRRLSALIEDKPFDIDDGRYDATDAATQQLIYLTTKLSQEQSLQMIEKQMQQVREQIGAAEIDIERLTKLAENAREHEERLFKVIDIVARNEYESVRKERIDYDDQIRMKRHEVSQLEVKSKELSSQKQYTIQDYNNKLLDELTAKSKEATALKVEVRAIEFKKSKQRITAPVDGYIGKLMVHTIGGVVTSAEKLISVIPKDVPLVIKATVMNQDIGFIKDGMEAAIKIDTYNFQKYGLLRGIVKHISDDSIDDEKLGPVFEVYIEPTEKTLFVEGETVTLNSGMSVTAELKVGKRRIIEFFIYPMIRYLDEGLSVK